LPYFDNICFTSRKQEIKGKEVARIKIAKITPKRGIKRDLDVIVALNICGHEFSDARQVIQYRLYTPDKKLLGHMRLEDTRVNNSVNYDLTYGNNQKKTDYISMNFLESIDDKSYKGIGQKLVQIAIEQSIKSGHRGKIKGLADKLGDNDLRELPSLYGCPTGFYYEKCHFKSDPVYLNYGLGKTDKEIEEELGKMRKQGRHPAEANLNYLRMYLPEKEFQNFWWPKIKENPIILSKNEIQKFEETLAHIS
jgi:hypothetical protein